MAVFQLSLPPALAEGGAGTEENRKIRSYLFQLTEQLRYTLNHLDDENFSEGGISPERIAGLGTEISKAAQAEIGKAKIGAAQIQHLEAQVAKIVTATLGTAVIDWAQIKELTAAVATIARAEIAAATIGWAQVEGVTANTALFTRTEADKLFAADLAVGDANIVDLNAGKINAGTLSVERLVLVGTDKSVMYEINRANGTTELSQSTLDGGSITEKTITAEQIVAGGITAECLNVSESRLRGAGGENHLPAPGRQRAVCFPGHGGDYPHQSSGGGRGRVAEHLRQWGHHPAHRADGGAGRGHAALRRLFPL